MAFAMRRSYERRAAVADAPVAPGTSGSPGRARLAAARGAWALGAVLLAIARMVRLLAGLIALLIVAAIVLKVLGANGANVVVKDVHDAAAWFVGPFKTVFSIRGAKLAMAVNWGLAVVVYVVVGGLIASLIARLAPTGLAPSEPVV